MTRATTLLLAAVTLASGPTVGQSPAEAFAAYERGDDAAAMRWVSTLGQRDNPLDEIAELKATRPYSRTAAAFLLEVAAARPSAPLAHSALSRGRELVMRRGPLGISDVDDRFEVLWHQTAMAIAQEHFSIPFHTAYLAAVLPRFESTSLHTRLRLASAIVLAEGCCPSGVVPDSIQWSPRIFEQPPTLARAVAAFDAVASDATLRSEALLRSAVVLTRAGRHLDAVPRLEQARVGLEPTLTYVHRLSLGRALLEVGRLDDAAGAFEEALATEADGQLAAIGLAATYLQMGRIDDAAAMATRAKRMRQQVGRGLDVLDKADGRFLHAWLTDIRRLRR